MTCNAPGTCGRPAGHRGWCGRMRGPEGAADLTPMQVRSLIEYVLHGDARQAAACLGMSYGTLKNHLASAHARTGATSTVQVLHQLGWITLPEYRHEGPA
jgi:DNA-binding CsgD family transcriptional regulator